MIQELYGKQGVNITVMFEQDNMNMSKTRSALRFMFRLEGEGIG